MDELENIYNVLILFYAVLPVSLILLRCITIKNVPKLDIFFLFNAFTAWFWIIWFLTIWATDLCYWPGQDSWPFGGLIIFLKPSLEINDDVRVPQKHQNHEKKKIIIIYL